MDMKSIETSISGLSSAIDAQFKKYDSEIAEMKTAFSAGATSKKADEAQYVAFKQFLCEGKASPALTTSTTNAGAIVTPQFEGASILDRMKDENPILQLVHHVNVDGHGSLSVPVFTSEVVPATTAENGAITATNATVALKNVTLSKKTCKTQYSIEMGACYSPYDFAQEISAQVATEMGQAVADDVSATILADSTVGTVTSANATKITYDDLVDLMSAVPSKADNNGAFICNKRTFGNIIKSFGTASGYVQMPLSADNQPMILGKPVYFVPNMDDVAATKSCLMYGDFDHATRYVTNGGIEMLPDRYTGAGNGLVTLWSYALTGCDVVRPESLAKLVQKAS